MFQPLSFCIGLRYTRAKRRNHFISFISLASILGIALGVMVLITVLSVMNGFDYEIRSKIFNTARQVTVSKLFGTIENWQDLSKQIKPLAKVKGIAPYVEGQAMLTYKGIAQGVMVTGILPEYEEQVSIIGQNMISGSMTDLQAGKFGIVLSQDLAASLAVRLGDKLTLVIPKTDTSPVGVVPRFKRFTVLGTFKVNGGFGLDQQLAYINLNDAQKLFQIKGSVAGLRIKVNELYDALQVTDEIYKTLQPGYMVNNWTEQYRAYFKAIRMEKTMMFVILLFIIAVATFNLVSTLVMVVTDKQADIAILRTLGASPGMIMRTFMVQGCVVGLFGTLLGVIGGVTLAINAPALVHYLEQLLQIHFISSTVYFIDYLPSRLDWMDVVDIASVAFLMSLIATLYPAWRAARVQAAEALRYE